MTTRPMSWKRLRAWYEVEVRGAMSSFTLTTTSPHGIGVKKNRFFTSLTGTAGSLRILSSGFRRNRMCAGSNLVCGKRGIQPRTSRFNGFQDRRNRYRFLSKSSTLFPFANWPATGRSGTAFYRCFHSLQQAFALLPAGIDVREIFINFHTAFSLYTLCYELLAMAVARLDRYREGAPMFSAVGRCAVVLLTRFRPYPMVFPAPAHPCGCAVSAAYADRAEKNAIFAAHPIR